MMLRITSQADISKDLQVERAAHDETAEKMVQLQQRLEVTLQVCACASSHCRQSGS